MAMCRTTFCLKVVVLLLILCGLISIAGTVIPMVNCENVYYYAQPSVFSGLTLLIHSILVYLYAIRRPYVKKWNDWLLPASTCITFAHTVISGLLPIVAGELCIGVFQETQTDIGKWCNMERGLTLGSSCGAESLRTDNAGQAFAVIMISAQSLAMLLLCVESCFVNKLYKLYGVTESIPEAPKPVEGEAPALPDVPPSDKTVSKSSFMEGASHLWTWTKNKSQSINDPAPKPDKPATDEDYMDFNALAAADGKGGKDTMLVVASQKPSQLSQLEGGPPPGNSALIRALGLPPPIKPKDALPPSSKIETSEINKDDGLYDNMHF